MAISAIKTIIRKIFLFKRITIMLFHMYQALGSLQSHCFFTLIYIADMAIQMCNINNFDIDQMSSKFAQR